MEGKLFVKKLFRARDKPEEYRDEMITFVKAQAEKRREERALLERQWTLNANFLMGNQYCAINTFHGGVIEELPRISYYEQREVFNRIAPLYSTRDANLAKVTYDMRVRPATNELDDYYKSEISTAILKAAKEATNFTHLNKIGRSWAEITGSVFYYVYWDKNAGDEYARAEEITVDDDGNANSAVNIIRSGEVGTCLLTPYEIFPESLYKQGIDSQRSIIVEQIATVDEVRDTYGIEVQGGSVQAFDISPSPVTGGYGYISTVSSISTHTVENAAKVITYFETASSQHPDGRMIVVAGDELVFYGDLPFGEIPIVQQTCVSVAGQFFGKSWIEDIIPAQRAYNGVVNRLHDYIRSAAINNYAVQSGSLEDIDEYREYGIAPGEIIEYKNGHNPPEPLPVGSLPAEVTNEIYRLQSEMEYMAGLSHLQLYGDSQNSVTAASAIAQLREVDDTRLSQTAESIRLSVKSVARMWLKLYKKHARLSRVIKSTGANMFGSAIVWCGEDISDNDIVFVTENELLNSPEKQQERFLQAWQMGLFADENGVVPADIRRKAIKMLKTNDWEDGLSVNDLQMSKAARENNMFENGVFPKVGEFDDHSIHVQEHMRYILQTRFELLKQRKPEYAGMIVEHLKEHQRIIAQNEQQQIQQTARTAPAN